MKVWFWCSATSLLVSLERRRTERSTSDLELKGCRSKGKVCRKLARYRAFGSPDASVAFSSVGSKPGVTGRRSGSGGVSWYGMAYIISRLISDCFCLRTLVLPTPHPLPWWHCYVSDGPSVLDT